MIVNSGKYIVLTINFGTTTLKKWYNEIWPRDEKKISTAYPLSFESVVVREKKMSLVPSFGDFENIEQNYRALRYST